MYKEESYFYADVKITNVSIKMHQQVVRSKNEQKIYQNNKVCRLRGNSDNDWHTLPISCSLSTNSSLILHVYCSILDPFLYSDPDRGWGGGGGGVKKKI